VSIEAETLKQKIRQTSPETLIEKLNFFVGIAYIPVPSTLALMPNLGVNTDPISSLSPE
jgi:hypothetical protein